MTWWKRRQIQKGKYWGLSSSINLYCCDYALIRNKEVIKKFVKELCDLIKVKRFDETIIVDFGDDPRISGFSMLQLIETSLISAHFVNQTNRVYLDIFSCSPYDPELAAEFAAKWFEAEHYTMDVSIRR